jgi:hypothetical protein
MYFYVLSFVDYVIKVYLCGVNNTSELYSIRDMRQRELNLFTYFRALYLVFPDILLVRIVANYFFKLFRIHAHEACHNINEQRVFVSSFMLFFHFLL